MTWSRLTLTIATIACGVLASAAPSFSQQLGTVTGRAIDQTGASLPGVAIDLVTAVGELTAATDGSGRYRFDSVPAGAAEVTFRLINFTVLRRAVAVSPGQTATVDATMLLSLSADVIVTASSTFRNVADAERPAENLVGIAGSASQGAITATQLEARPVMRAGEVLETVPGMVISQHSGEGKANQYYLRGFNLDHGTDFSTMVAGIPVNTPTGAHAHGYSDLGFLIPELVSGVQYKKGTYFADEGDFSAAGAATINYVNQLDRPLVRLSAGNNGWGRVLGAASPRVGDGFLLVALDVNKNDGPDGPLDRCRPFFASLRVRHFGPRALVEDRSVRSAGTTLWNGEAGYRVSNQARLVLELFNIFDAEVAAIDYFYSSRLPGEPDKGIDDVHTHPALPRSVRIGLQLSF